MASLNEINKPLQYVKVDTASSGANTLLAGVSGQKIFVYAGVLTAAGAVTATFKDGSTALTGAMSMATGTAVPFNPVPNNYTIFPPISGDFVMTLGGAVQVSGYFVCSQG